MPDLIFTSTTDNILAKIKKKSDLTLTCTTDFHIKLIYLTKY